MEPITFDKGSIVHGRTSGVRGGMVLARRARIQQPLTRPYGQPGFVSLHVEPSTPGQCETLSSSFVIAPHSALRVRVRVRAARDRDRRGSHRGSRAAGRRPGQTTRASGRRGGVRLPVRGPRLPRRRAGRRGARRGDPAPPHRGAEHRRSASSTSSPARSRRAASAASSRAHDERLGRPVAIKELLVDANDRAARALRARGAAHRAPPAPGHRARLRGRPLADRRAVLRDEARRRPLAAPTSSTAARTSPDAPRAPAARARRRRGHRLRAQRAASSTATSSRQRPRRRVRRDRGHRLGPRQGPRRGPHERAVGSPRMPLARRRGRSGAAARPHHARAR